MHRLRTNLSNTNAEFCLVRGTALLAPRKIFRILICRPTHSLGNTLLLTPLLQELQSTFSGAEIDIVTRTQIAAELFGHFSNVGQIMCLPDRVLSSPAKFVQVLSHLRNTRYDLVIDPHPRSRSGRALLGLAHGTVKLGFSGFKDRTLTHAVPVPGSTRHTGQLPLHLLRTALGLTSSSIVNATLNIALSDNERREGGEMLLRVLRLTDADIPLGTIGVFANATGTKQFSQDWWRSLLDVLAERYPAHTILEIVPVFGRSMLASRYNAFYSTNLRRLASVLSQLSIFVSGDCGIMHLACAAGAPVTGIFSVTDPAEWGPYGERDSVIDARGLTPQQVAVQIKVPNPQSLSR